MVRNFKILINFTDPTQMRPYTANLIRSTASGHKVTQYQNIN